MKLCLGVKIRYILPALFLAVVLVLFLSVDFKNVKAQSSDAIAIRVISNPEHYSAYHWYKKQNFTGSPQSVEVDGYEAVRDGRTVYVNAANVYMSQLYTNIYLISYNQSADTATADIFSGILSKWQFNTNISNSGHCREEGNISCSSDHDCPINDNCDNPKVRIVRDTLRISGLVAMSELLDQYKDDNGRYPLLSAGSYLPNKTLSVWPSWSNTLGKELDASLPLDPVNDLGDCSSPSGYNPGTCWNEGTKKYILSYPAMPKNSLAYAYFTNATGSVANLCVVYESGLAIATNNPRSSACGDPNCLDFDGDGYGSPASSKCTYPTFDCDDTNASVHSPAGMENCTNGIDDDCDGLADCNDMDCVSSCTAGGPCNYNGTCDAGETCASCALDGCCGPPTCPDGFCDTSCECSTCVADCFGNAGCCGQAGCNPAIGECSNCTTDCNANIVADCCGNGICDSTINENITNCSTDCGSTCVDNDGDFYIQGSGPYSLCMTCGPLHNVACSGHEDCNDANNTVYPTAPDNTCNSIDNDCDSKADEDADPDLCGTTCTDLGFDWNNARGTNLKCCGNDTGEGNPAAGTYFTSETGHCSDSIDNDCDGSTDGADSDCGGSCGYVNEVNWNIAGEPDCNQCDHEGDDDTDQSPGNWSLYPGMADFCDADCGTVLTTVTFANFQNGAETTCDGFDNDCDGSVDESLTGANCPLTQGVCTGAKQQCVSGTWQACTAASYGGDYDSIEIHCTDGKDNDCDGDTDVSDSDCLICTDADSDGHYATGAGCPTGDDCDDSNKYRYPGNTETCDTQDNDCDGTVDEGCDDDGDGYCDSSMQIYNNSSMCTNTTFTVNGMIGNDCDDNAATGAAIHPSATELCDGINNDCSAATADGSGESWYEAGTEISCTDTHDNDCDSLTDSLDLADCNIFCNFTATFPCIFN